ncbi:MAG: alpha/beta hydrolase [Phycisphaerales bacterium JB059]
MRDWTITGSEGLDLLGVTDTPDAEPRGVAIIVHGFKGYLDYGLFPSLARRLAEEGWIAHRFNLAHSGMTRNTATFERPDLFARDRWRHQIEDVMSVVGAVRAGRIEGRGLPLVLIGHSRGGATCLLSAGRHADDLPELSAVVTINAPDACCRMSAEDQARLLREGRIESPSARTGQVLTIEKGWLQEQLDDLEAHDVLAQAGRIRVPALVLHAGSDQTVSPEAAVSIAGALRPPVEPVLIPDADHVLNTPNPWPSTAPPPPPLGEALDRLASFLREIPPSQNR